MNKELHFIIRGTEYKVNERGLLTQCNWRFSGGWQFLGVSYHHWRRGIDINLKEAFENPKLLIKGLVWDRDHGTIRQWGGSYYGKLPRITCAWIE